MLMGFAMHKPVPGLPVMGRALSLLSVISCALLLLLACPSAQAIAQNCSGNAIVGSDNSINCAQHAERPTHAEAMEAILAFNKSVLYSILGSSYDNGYANGDGTYSVAATLSVELKVSCGAQGLDGMPSGGGDSTQRGIAQFAIGLAMMMKFGADCKAGDEYDVPVLAILRDTEDGWMMDSQQ